MNATTAPSRPTPAMAGVNWGDGTIQIPCEPINEWLAIHSEFAMDKEGHTILTGFFTITHLPTGMAFTSSSGCINCARKSGAAIAAMSLDFAQFGTSAETNKALIADLSQDQRIELSALRDLSWLCDADYCDAGEF